MSENEAEIIAYARKRLQDKVAPVEIVTELMERWPVRVTEMPVAISFVTFAQQSISPIQIFEIPCPICKGIPSQKEYCSTCDGTGTLSVSKVSGSTPKS